MSTNILMRRDEAGQKVSTGCTFVCVQNIQHTVRRQESQAGLKMLTCGCGSGYALCLPTKSKIFTTVEAWLGSSSTPLGIVAATKLTEKDSVPSEVFVSL